MIALVGVVEHHIQDDLDARPVQGFHHITEIREMAACARRLAITAVRREEADGAVAPEIAQSLAVRSGAHRKIGIELECRQKFHCSDAERLQVRDLLDDAGEGARTAYPGGR